MRANSRRLLHASMLTLILLAGGCASSSNNLTMTGLDQKHDYKEVFSHAYSALNPNGDYDIVLIHDANSDARSNTTGELSSAPMTPRQVVHIRVFWLPERGAKLDHPVATNAAIRWLVFGDRHDEANDLLEYAGSGLVLVKESGTTATVEIRGASLKVSARRGEMTDPLGPSSVSGLVTTQIDRAGVDAAMREIDAARQGGTMNTARAGE